MLYNGLFVLHIKSHQIHLKSVCSTLVMCTLLSGFKCSQSVPRFYIFSSTFHLVVLAMVWQSLPRSIIWLENKKWWYCNFIIPNCLTRSVSSIMKQLLSTTLPTKGLIFLPVFLFCYSSTFSPPLFKS